MYDTLAGEDPYDSNHHPEYDREGGQVVHETYSMPMGEQWFATEFPLIEVRFGE